MKNIFNYLDYREYLQEYYDYRKSVTPWYSLKVMGESIGLDQSQVFRILRKQLHLSKAATPRMLKYLNLPKNEELYFCTLVDFSKSKKESDTQALFAKILELRGNSSQVLQENQLQLYSEWYIPIIRAMIGCMEWKDDYTKLAKHVSPSITEAQAKQAIKILESIGLIALNKEGFYHPTNNSLTTGSHFYSHIVKHYQAQTFRLAENSLAHHPKCTRDINVVNMAVDDEAFEDCKTIIAEARKQIRNRIEQVSKPDRILRLATALFPVATIPTKGL